jgi:hypothetical protein
LGARRHPVTLEPNNSFAAEGLMISSRQNPSFKRLRRFARWLPVRRKRRLARETAIVSIHVRDLYQLFNALDPSPLVSRDIGRAAAEFIEREFRDKRGADSWQLRVFVSADSLAKAELREAVKNHYGRQASSADIALREHFWMARLQLLGGIAIFAAATAARALLPNLPMSVPMALSDALAILGGLALWGPAEALLYEWVPLLRTRRLFQRLAKMQVSVQHDSAIAMRPRLHTIDAEAQGAGLHAVPKLIIDRAARK